MENKPIRLKHKDKKAVRLKHKSKVLTTNNSKEIINKLNRSLEQGKSKERHQLIYHYKFKAAYMPLILL